MAIKLIFFDFFTFKKVLPKKRFFNFFLKKSVFDQKQPQKYFFSKSQENNLIMFLENKQNGYNSFCDSLLLRAFSEFRANIFF